MQLSLKKLPILNCWVILFYHSFGPISFARAYINFKNRDDIIKFRDHFDGYRFVSSKGTYSSFFFIC